MLKKSLLILFIIFTILCISNICFATDMGNTVKNAVGNGTNTVVDGVSNLASDVRNGVGHVENGIEDALTMDDSNNTNLGITANTGMAGDYTTTRADAAGAGTDTTTMWVWIILAIAAIVIVALVWYYGSQNHID